MTLLESRLMVLQTTPAQPRSYDLAITRALVPGGPEASRNGFSKCMPSTSIASEGAMAGSLPLRGKRSIPSGTVLFQPPERALGHPDRALELQEVARLVDHLGVERP